MRRMRTLTCPRAIAAIVALAATTGAAGAVTLNRASSAEPGTLDPHVATGNTAAPILYDLFVGLTTFDVNGKLIPGAAESWTVSPDGLTYTFRLRAGLKWSDGSPLDSADFRYAVRRVVTPATASRFASFFYPVKNARKALKGEVPPEQVGVETPDARTVVYRLEYPAPYFLQLLGSNVASPVPRQQVEKLGRQWTRPGTMLSNGPYRLVEWVPNDHVTLQKNPHFYDAAGVRVDTVKWYPTENQATSLKRYLAGEVDILLNFPTDQLPSLKNSVPNEIRIWPGLMLNYLVLNNRRPPFNDARVRTALAISIDREGIVEKIVTPGSLAAYGVTPAAVTGYQPPVPDYARLGRQQRLAEARRLMQAAGYGPAKPLAFDLKYATLEENRRLAVALAAMWQAIGVQATPMNLELNAVNKAARTGDFAMLSYSWFAPADDAYTFLGLAETGNPNNYSGYSNPAYDRLLSEANAVMDPVRRAGLLSQAEASMLADHPIIPVFFYVRRFLVKPYVQGFEPNPRGLNLSRWISVSK